jgi:hypothetical protein
MLVVRHTRLRWSLAADASGEFVTLALLCEEPQSVSVPPFSYVAKRHQVANAEVFKHFFEQVPSDVIGFVRPEQWPEPD